MEWIIISLPQGQMASPPGTLVQQVAVLEGDLPWSRKMRFSLDEQYLVVLARAVIKSRSFHCEGHIGPIEQWI